MQKRRDPRNLCPLPTRRSRCGGTRHLIQRECDYIDRPQSSVGGRLGRGRKHARPEHIIQRGDREIRGRVALFVSGIVRNCAPPDHRCRKERNRGACGSPTTSPKFRLGLGEASRRAVILRKSRRRCARSSKLDSGQHIRMVMLDQIDTAQTPTLSVTVTVTRMLRPDPGDA